MKRGPKPQEGIVRDKWGHILCAHGKQSVICKDCKALGIGGIGICEHNKRRSQCKECDGSDFCEHHRRRLYCRECKALGIGGSQICEHGCSSHRCSICCPEGAFKQYKSNAKKQKIPFLLTFEQFISIVSQSCFYCPEDVKPRGVDRWNSDKRIGYRFDNCRPCCSTCNFAKGQMDGSTFVEWLHRAADHTR